MLLRALGAVLWTALFVYILVTETAYGLWAAFRAAIGRPLPLDEDEGS